MIDELEEEIEYFMTEAVFDLEQMGVDVEVDDSAFSTHIPNDRIAYYDPREDVVYVSKNPLSLSKRESVELMTEMQKQIMRGQSTDEARMEELKEEYFDTLELERSAREPLEELFTLLEKTAGEELGPASINPALEEYKIILDRGNEEAMNRLVGENRTSIYDQTLEELDADEEIREEAEFYKKLVAENYDFLQAAIERKTNLEETMRYSMKTAREVDDKVLQAASLLIGPLNHGGIQNLTEKTQDDFVGNMQIEDMEIKDITEELINNWNKASGRPEERFRDALQKTREYRGQS